MKFAATTLALVLAAALGASSAFAATTNTKPQRQLTPQQQKMKDCNAEGKAKGLKSKELIDFRKTCMQSASTAATAPAAAQKPAAAPASSAHASAATQAKPAAKPTTAAKATTTASAKPAKPLTPQQQKMKSCNSEAAQKKLAGDERKTFLSNCLKADAATAH